MKEPGPGTTSGARAWAGRPRGPHACESGREPATESGAALIPSPCPQPVPAPEQAPPACPGTPERPLAGQGPAPAHSTRREAQGTLSLRHNTPARPAVVPLLLTEALFPQEILEEVVRELHKVKEEIIDGEPHAAGFPWQGRACRPGPQSSGAGAT